VWQPLRSGEAGSESATEGDEEIVEAHDPDDGHGDGDEINIEDLSNNTEAGAG